MTTKEYCYQGPPEVAGSAKAYRMKRLCTIRLPVPETTEELAHLFRRVPAETYARLCVQGAKMSGGDIRSMALWLYAATLFPRLRARRERQEAKRKAGMSKFERELEERYDLLPAGQYMMDLLGIA